MWVAYLVSVLLQGRLILQVGPASRESASLSVDVQTTVNTIQLAVCIKGGNLIAL